MFAHTLGSAIADSICGSQKEIVKHRQGAGGIFQKSLREKSGDPYEFDRVMNLDHFANPGDVADIVALAFNKKFKTAM